MSLLITGCGLVGSQVARLAIDYQNDSTQEMPVILLDINPRLDALAEVLDTKKVTVIQGDVLNVHDLYQVIRSFDVSRIIHTAANPLLTLGAKKSPYRAIQLNIMGTANVLEASRVYDIERVVLASSNVISINSAKGPFGYPLPTTIYSSAKLACEHLGLNYFTEYGIDFAATRFSAAFGPWKYGGGGGPTQRFREMLQNALNGSIAILPSARMEYVYSKDAALGALLAMRARKSSLKSRVYNISMGRIYSADELKSIIEDIIPTAKIEIVIGTMNTHDAAEEQLADLTTAKNELGFVPKYDMRDAIKDYVNSLNGNTV